MSLYVKQKRGSTIVQPTNNEIEEISSAFVTLGIVPFSAEERRHLTRFLHQSAIEFNEQEAQKVFSHEIAIEAMKTLNLFANNYQDHEIMHEFNDEIVDLLLNVNNMHGALVI